ncbi:unannotated protein [freshwater metagenome]|uniref:Unannotated protein n=1 Tax=freshwater metagenome TaxID=449393 RepID=A0A6J7E114_9ZZZZ|nr:hypothetical protein [Actinomycetota bacterium]
MDISAELTAPCSTSELFGWIDDLASYAKWMGLVHRAEPIADRGGLPAWDVELRARLGPFARSKRLTMVRSICNPGSEVVFERSESDGRSHSVWRLGATVTPLDSGSHLTMRLHYGGGLWTGGLVERALADEINASRDRLLSLIAATTR